MFAYIPVLLLQLSLGGEKGEAVYLLRGLSFAGGGGAESPGTRPGGETGDPAVETGRRQGETKRAGET